MNSIEGTDFKKVEIRAGTMARVEDFPEARKPAFNILIYFGEEIGYTAG